MKTITLTNYGDKAVTYTVSSAPSAQSEKAKIVLSQSKVTVPAGGKAKVVVALGATTNAVGSSTAGPDQFSFYEFSGDIVLKSSADTLRVPYLLVPRSTSRVAVIGGDPLFKKNSGRRREKSVKLSNRTVLSRRTRTSTRGVSATRRTCPSRSPTPGYDLRAAGVQSFADGDDQILVFAVNTHTRWSNAASNEFDVAHRHERGRRAGLGRLLGRRRARHQRRRQRHLAGVRVQPGHGRPVRHRASSAAPTDSSTILLPVYASDLGITAETATFSYTVESYSVEATTGRTRSTRMATYNPWAPALSNGQYVSVPRNGSVTVPVTVDAEQFAAQKPLGVMAVVLDNESGAREALLVKAQ